MRSDKLTQWRTLRERLQAPSTEMYGSYPSTSMPRWVAILATFTPMAPRPTTPRVLPASSGPVNWLFPFSTSLPMASPWPASVLAHSMPLPTLRLASTSPPSTSSFTALALAPGVLNTTMPASLHLSTGILLTPAPARAMPSRLSGSAISCMAALRTRMPSGCAPSSSTANRLLERRSSPLDEILFSVLILYIFVSPCSGCASGVIRLELLHEFH